MGPQVHRPYINRHLQTVGCSNVGFRGEEQRCQHHKAGITLAGQSLHLEGRLRAQRLRVPHGGDGEAIDARPRQHRQGARLDDAGGRVVRQPVHVRRREPVQQPCAQEVGVKVTTRVGLMAGKVVTVRAVSRRHSFTVLSRSRVRRRFPGC